MGDDDEGISRHKLRLVKAGADIRTAPPARNETQAIHAGFASVSLPTTKPDPSQRHWDAKNGMASLRVEAGSIGDPRTGEYEAVGLPYGPAARIILIYLTTEAQKTKRATIEVGSSLKQFIRRLGYTGQGSDYKAIREQLRRLAVAKVRMFYPEGDGITSDRLPSEQFNCSFVRRMSLWSGVDERQGSLWQQTVTLSSEFFEAVLRHGLPLDERAIAALRKSAVALDIYIWLAWRLYTLEGKPPAVVSWKALKAQFGQDVAAMRRFRQTFRDNLRHVLAVYPAAESVVEDLGEAGVRLSYAPPPVPTDRLALTASAAEKPWDKPR